MSGTGSPEQCDNYIAWTTKYRFRVLSGLVKDLVDHAIRLLSEWKGCEVIELNVQADHIHLVVSFPPNVSISELMGTLKGKLAIKLFKSYGTGRSAPTQEEALLGGIISSRARGYFVNTVGINESYR